MVQKHLLILGGAGKTGVMVVKQALKGGNKVTAYARNADKLREECGDALKKEQLTLIECDIPSLHATLAPLLPSFATIISVLGPNSLNYTGTEIAQLYEWMIGELRTLPTGQRPYIVIISTQSIVDPEDGFDLFTKIHIFFIMTIAAGARRETMAIKEVFMKEVASQKSDIDWTVCRLNLLKDTGLPIEGGHAGYVAKNGWLSTMDRAQLAYWLINEAEKQPAQRQWVRKMPALWGDDKV